MEHQISGAPTGRLFKKEHPEQTFRLFALALFSVRWIASPVWTPWRGRQIRGHFLGFRFFACFVDQSCQGDGSPLPFREIPKPIGACVETSLRERLPKPRPVMIESSTKFVARIIGVHAPHCRKSGPAAVQKRTSAGFGKPASTSTVYHAFRSSSITRMLLPHRLPHSVQAKRSSRSVRRRYSPKRCSKGAGASSADWRGRSPR